MNKKYFHQIGALYHTTSSTISLEKGGKKAVVGEVRYWDGEAWVKHSDGWVRIGRSPLSSNYLVREEGDTSGALKAEKHHIEFAKPHLEKHLREKASSEGLEENHHVDNYYHKQDAPMTKKEKETFLSNFRQEQRIKKIRNQKDFEEVISSLPKNHESLDISNCGIHDLSCLANLKNLKTLNLQDNQISDLSPLANLKNLKSIVLDGNQISDLSPISGLENLESLNLSYNQISDIKPLGKLKNLGFLDLSANTSISDISALKGLENLWSLNLDYNKKITKIPVFKNLEKFSFNKNNDDDE
jgi:hypothetical protein